MAIGPKEISEWKAAADDLVRTASRARNADEVRAKAAESGLLLAVAVRMLVDELHRYEAHLKVASVDRKIMAKFVALNDEARSLLGDLSREREETLALLREVEWSGENDGAPACPVCQAYAQRSAIDRKLFLGKHRDDCRLAAFLRGA